MKMLKTLSMQKFASAAVYFSIHSIFLIILTGWYGQMILTGSVESSNRILQAISILLGKVDLSNPLVFAIAVLLIGLLTSLVYWAYNCILKVIMTTIFKRETNVLNFLSAEESTMIGVVTCLLIGIACYISNDGNPELAIMHQMLFSLPIAKIAFITSSVKEIKNDISNLIRKSKKVWPFLIFMAVQFLLILFCEKYEVINVLITIAVIFIFLYHDAKYKPTVSKKPKKRSSSSERKAQVIACCEQYEKEILDLQTELKKAKKETAYWKDKASK